MKIESLELAGAYSIEPELFHDPRGYFYEWFNVERFSDNTGIDFRPVQFNCSKSSKGVLRGMHFQVGDMAQTKVIGVNHGEIQDVIIDIRKGSPSYGKWYSEVLSAEKKNQLFVPKGFAHGFLVLSETAEIFYAIDCSYSPDHEEGILYNDSNFNIDWLLPESEIILSEKDKNRKKYTTSKFTFHE